MVLSAYPTDAELLKRCLRESRLGLMDSAAANAIALIERSTDQASAPLHLDARIRLIWIQFQNGQHEAARETAKAAIKVAMELGDEGRESLARSYHARVLCEGDAVSEAADESIAALRLARNAGNPTALSNALVVPAILCSRLGLYDASVELSRQAVLQAELSGDAEALAHSISNYGSLHADYLYRYAVVSAERKREYLDIALEQSLIATTLARDHEDGEMQRLPGYNLVEFRLLAGDVAGAEDMMRMTDAAIGTRSRRSEIQRGHVHALLTLEQDQPARAITALRESLERCLAYPFTELALFASEHLSRVLSQNGQDDAAYQEHQRFHRIYRAQNSEAHSRHMQSSIILDRIAEMRRLIDAETARVARLATLNEALASERERLAKETMEDPLTGLPNRRQLDLLFTALAEENTPHAILLIDIDRFKLVNDRYSHVIGDVVLRTVATLLRTGVMMGAAGNVAARLGGEEFAVVLTTHPLGARDVCETLRMRIATHDWEQVAPGLSVTVSLGLAMSDEGADAAERVAMADERLYDAKHLGRNRSIFHDRFRASRMRAQSG